MIEQNQQMSSTAVALKTDGKKDLNPNEKQGRASDPLSSVWVGASAGTGKTKVLTDRVLRLMLPRFLSAEQQDEMSAEPTSPDRILCITFTKAAAAEMAERISKTLSEWAVIPEEELIKKLKNLTGRDPEQSIIDAARRLFARVVDVPGGMKIMTIHSFCQSILKRFPLEAGLPPHFEVLDDRTAMEYMTACQQGVIRTAFEEKGGDFDRAVTHLTSIMQPEDMTKLLSSIAQERVRLNRIITQNGGIENTIHLLYQIQGLDVGSTQDDILKPFCQNRPDETTLRQVCAALATGSPTDQKRSQQLQHWLDAPLEKRMAFIAEYQNIFLTKKNTILKNLSSKGSRETMPEIDSILGEEAECVLNLLDHTCAIKVAQGTAALLKIANEILRRYQDRKDQASLLDYDDLIYRTRDLLKTNGQAGWVLYKLDRGIDHILIDEAQDTNPEQWQVISSLVEEFFAGQGARDDVERTAFVVGDEKQSIFSFQRADPAEFHRMRRYFETLVTGSGKNWSPVDMDISFRSTPAVLQMVDHLFENEQAKQGVVMDKQTLIHHEPYRQKQAGLVELWPMLLADKDEDAHPWSAPVVRNSSQTPAVVLADKIAQTIEEWIKTGEVLQSSGKVIDAGDIMILVRNRRPFVEPMVKALKSRNIPVSGVDRMVLNEQLAVMDLLALAQFLLLPEDDLTLATVLKTPLIGLNEEDLFKLAHNRSGSLWQAVKSNGGYVAQYLSHLLQTMRSATPYDFFSEILHIPCPADQVSGKRAFLNRLGHDVLDALDELLNACLEFEMMHAPSLQVFLNWFAKGSAEVKRQQDQEESIKQVRIMTVHGSKGLQAPIVFMPDTVSLPGTGPNRPRLLWPDGDRDNKTTPLWALRQDMESEVYKERKKREEAKQKDEYKRLLYVAMTRAEDRLYIAGFGNKKTKSAPEGSWYDLVYKSMSDAPDMVRDQFLINGEVLIDPETTKERQVWRVENGQGGLKEKPKNVSERLGKKPLPDWARSEPNPEPSPPKPLTPSRPAEEEPAMRAPLEEDDGYKFKRGLLVHHLLEILPDLPQTGWEQAMRTYLSRPVHDLNETQINDLIKEILDVLNHPEFAPIFGPTSKAEVPVVGLLDEMESVDNKIVSGEIDRLVVMEDCVMIVDYKTNRPPPTRKEDVPNIYLKQMQAYATAVQKIYPDKQIKTALLWTDGPYLMPL